MKLLLVDDDNDILENNAQYLIKRGYEILLARDGAQALALAGAADLIVLDVGLPDIDGFALAPMLTEISNVPVLFLTARDSDEAMESGFALGSDYMKKPYSLKELSLRIEAVIRNKTNKNDGYIDLPPLTINIRALSAEANGELMALTPREFVILVLFAENTNQVLTYKHIYNAVWGENGFEVSVVAQHVSSLRRKLESSGASGFIKTIRGVGYSFAYPPEKANGEEDG